MRIGVAGFFAECCTFSPLISTKGDFVILRGAELIDSLDFLIEFSNVTFVPIVRATTLPGGSVDRKFYAKIKEEILKGISDRGPLDGIFLCFHGSAHVQGISDVEGDLTESIRRVVGRRCIICSDFDLHGNLSSSAFENLDLLTAYRTAPHTDEEETAKRAVNLLIDTLNRGVVPSKSFVKVPVLLPGEKTSTNWEPGKSLYMDIRRAIESFDLLDASILVGYPWADKPHASASVVTYGMDPSKTREAATTLANQLWNFREDFEFGSYAASVDDCIKEAMKIAEGPAVMSDSGDNPTAGGAGDVPHVLERMLSLGVSDAVYAGIVDPDAVNTCGEAGIGKMVELKIGGKLDSLNGSPLSVKAKVVGVFDSQRKYGMINDGNRVAVVSVSGILVILTEKRTPFHHISDFERLGIDPLEHRLLVVKIGYLVTELKKIATKSFLALSPGTVNQNLTALPFEKLKRPIYPFDPDMEWNPSHEVLTICPR